MDTHKKIIIGVSILSSIVIVLGATLKILHVQPIANTLLWIGLISPILMIGIYYKSLFMSSKK